MGQFFFFLINSIFSNVVMRNHLLIWGTQQGPYRIIRKDYTWTSYSSVIEKQWQSENLNKKT